MNKHTKLLLTAGLITAGSIAFLAAAGNYYVNVAIRRGKKKYSNEKRKKNKNSGRDISAFKGMALTHAAMKKESEALLESLKEQKLYEELTISASDSVNLYGELYKNNSHKYVVIVHGYNCTLADMYPYASEFYKKGYNLLFIDMRAHGKSGGEYIGMGWLERLDIKKWCETICQTDPEANILLFGQSMGAAAVMMACGEDLPVNVKCAVEDSGYTSVSAMYKILMKEAYHLPSFPLLNAADVVAKRRAGYSFYGADAVAQLKRSDMPMLFIHAEGDSFVPFEMVHALYDAAPEPKEIYTIPEGDHICACFCDKEEYFRRVFAFADKYMDP